MKKRNGWLAIGGGAAIIGLALAGSTFSLGHPGVALAGDSTPSPVGCDITATPTDIPDGNIQAFQAPPSTTPVATCTPTKVKTHTPTPKPTDVATETPDPATNTPVPPPPTNTPSGTTGGVVTPPNTGTGGDAGSGNMLWVLIAGALVVAGGGAMVIGARTKA